jgi:hypothetical protein
LTRATFIERVRRQIYGGQPSDDASITVGLVNNYLNDAIAVAAKANYKENIAIDGINFVNNSFYTTYKSLSVTADEQFLWKITLPEIPIGIGENFGCETLIFKDSSSNQLSYPVVFISQNQRSYARSMRPIPNIVLAYLEGQFVYVQSTIILSAYTAQATMISGGDSTNLQSTLNVPPDYFPVMMQYLQSQLLLEKAQPVDSANDGLDAIKTT